MLTDSFKELIEGNLPFVKICITGMTHPEKERAEKYLALMNSLLDFYLMNPVEGETPRYTLIHLPKCPDWAEDVFFEFLTFKLVFSNENISNRIKKEGEDCVFKGCKTKKELAKEKERRRYLKSLVVLMESCKKYLERKRYGNIGESLVFFQKNRLDTYKRRQKFNTDFIGDFPTKNIAVASDEIRGIKKEAKKLNNGGFSSFINNIIVFNSRNRVSKTFTKTEIDKLNQSNAGVKNVIIFDFSAKPFVLNNLFEKRNNLASQYAQKKGNETEFVSFSKDELNYVFGTKCNSEMLECGAEENFLIFEANVKDVVDAMEYPVKNRNNLSVCYDNTLMDSLLETHEGFLEIEDFEIYVKGIQKDWPLILPKIKTFKDDDDMAVVFVDPEKSYAEKFQTFIAQQIGSNVGLFSLYDLKKGNIHQKKIVFFQYRSHNASTIFAKWPNSFDEFKLEPEQKILVLIQKSVFTDKFEWDMYDYRKLSNLILTSDYRCKLFPDSQEKPIKPSFAKLSLREDNDSDEINVQNYCYQINAENRWSKKMYGTDYLLLCDTHEDSDYSMSIKQVRSIYEEGESQYLWYQGRPIDELVKYLDEIVDKKAKDESIQEIEYGKEYRAKYNINEDNKMELWRQILKKKMETDKTAYNTIKEIVKRLNPQDLFIKENRFKDWVNPKIALILPRTKRHQKALWEYLELKEVYLFFVRRRMRLQKNDSKERNRVLTEFIVRYYYNHQEDDYEDYQSNDAFTEYLPLNKDEFEELISALHDEIQKNDIWAHMEITKC